MEEENIENVFFQEIEQVPKKKISWPFMTLKSFTISIILKASLVGVLWGWGYMNWSFAWLIPPIILSVWKTEKTKNGQLKRLTAQATVMAKENEIIISRLDELPTWVYFPDFDRVEWLNQILCKVWPGMNQFVRNLVRDSIQPAIVQSLAEYKIPSFEFERLVLGRVPPKIYGIKVYEKNTSRNEIILDCDILYAGDCDISFFIGNIKGGIRDFQIRGMLRIVMKPMLTVMPLVGGLQIFFLNNPSIDFNFVGVADFFEFPGLNQVLRKVIKEQVAAIVVLPNKLIIPLSQDIPAEKLKTPEPEGVLRIHVVQAKHLMKKDIGVLGKGKSDPYAVVSVGAQEFRTKTIDNTINPQWDYWCEFIVESSSGIYSRVIIQLFDKDNTGQDDPLGRANIEISQVKKKGVIDTWLALEHAKHGMVQLRLTWFKLTTHRTDLQAALIETQQLRVTSMSTAVLILYVDSAKNLPCLKGSKQPDVFLQASVGGKTERTTTMLRSCDPIWEQGFSLLVANPETGALNIIITDEKTGLSIGNLVYTLSSLLTKNNLEEVQQPYDLDNSGSDSKLIMSLSLRILKYEKPEQFLEADDSDNELDINDLKKKIERQESNLSRSLNSSAPPTPLKKQPSKESIQNLINNGGNDQLNTSINISEKEENIEKETIIPFPVKNNQLLQSELIKRTPSVTSSAGDYKLGRIQITLRYSITRQKLIIVIHKIANIPLPHNDLHNIPDPYVKLYLLPDRHKDNKRKTVVIKDNCNPVYDEQFEYTISQGDLHSRTLEITVCTQKAWLSAVNNIIGQVNINLSLFNDLTQPISNWYDLMPDVKD